MNKLGRGPLDDASYQISKLWAFLVYFKIFFADFPIYKRAMMALYRSPEYNCSKVEFCIQNIANFVNQGPVTLDIIIRFSP